MASKRHPYISGHCGIGRHHNCTGTYAGILCACSICGHGSGPDLGGPPPVKNLAIGATASYRLIEASIGRPLSAHVAECRSAGLGWRQIATDLRDATHVGVSHESLRGWFK
jgi:hypothetical protein